MPTLLDYIFFQSLKEQEKIANFSTIDSNIEVMSNQIKVKNVEIVDYH